MPVVAALPLPRLLPQACPRPRPLLSRPISLMNQFDRLFLSRVVRLCSSLLLLTTIVESATTSCLECYYLSLTRLLIDRVFCCCCSRHCCSLPLPTAPLVVVGSCTVDLVINGFFIIVAVVPLVTSACCYSSTNPIDCQCLVHSDQYHIACNSLLFARGICY